MSNDPEFLVLNAFNGWKARIETLTSPKPKRVYADPAEAVSLADFPCVVLSLDPDKQHSFDRKGEGVYRYDFYGAAWVFVGSRQTPLGELHSRALRWAIPLGMAILADQRLGDTVAYTGDGGATGNLFKHDVGFKQWAGGDYFGLKVSMRMVIVKPTTFG